MLKLTGTLTNAACTPSLSNGGVADYGRIMLSDLSPTDTNQLGNRDVTLSISCTSPTKVAWTIVDDRADSVQKLTIKNTGWNNGESWGNFLYGVGKTAGDVNLGAYAVVIHSSSITADGDSAQGLTSVPGPDDDVWVYMSATSEPVRPSLNMFTVGPNGSGSLYPKAYSNAVFPLRVSLAIQGTDALAITDDTNIDGQATISLVYI
ncbi:DUF1120 domain-containing protein [Enterobacter hormaechei]